MRAFSSSRISVSIVVAFAALLFGSLVVPDRATAREPEYEMAATSDGGGTSGGGEWKTNPSGDSQGLPVENGRVPGPGTKYTKGSETGVEASWVARVESWYIRLLKAVSAVIVHKYF